MNRKIRAAYFAGSMKPGQDGVTRVLYRLIDALIKEDIETVFFSPIIPSLEEQKVRMIKVPSVTFPLYKEYQFAVPGHKHFDIELKEFEPDIIHINSPCSLGCAAIKYANRHNIPVAATYHTHFPSYVKYYKIKALELCSWNYMRNLYNRCDAVFVPSVPIKDELIQHGFETVEFLPHGVDADVFNPVFRDDEWKKEIGAENKTVLLYAGRLVWEKDLNTLAECYKIISEKRKNVKFILAGDGPIREELKEMMPEAIFLGYQSGINLSRVYASSDIFVFPSTTETFGNVTLEAMASEIPPVCAREGGAYGIINDGVTGLVAEPGDAESLAEKLLTLIDDPQKRKIIAKEAYKYAHEQTWEKIFLRLFKRYNEIIDQYHLSGIRAA
jgi:glycosyltransferase involved in cell wall biosynthesis